MFHVNQTFRKLQLGLGFSFSLDIPTFMITILTPGHSVVAPLVGREVGYLWDAFTLVPGGRVESGDCRWYSGLFWEPSESTVGPRLCSFPA